MPWPTHQDYNEAVQNPQTAFEDLDLRRGKPALNALNLPRAFTGQFASVYEIGGNQDRWAVRCFSKDLPDQQRRYAAISAHLAQVHLPYTVNFDFLPNGIKVRGRWYPILKMEWVQGESLSSYVQKYLHSPGVLTSLAAQWAEMMKSLQQAKVAHGDLQHGNVLVTQTGLRLVDYDGMYVPALAGELSNELGHRNYQPPQRTKHDFGPSIDNFSAWVIYLSLIALSVDPYLWQCFDGGDECLVFRGRDFEHPTQSLLFAALENNKDVRIQSATALFKSLLELDLPTMPTLDGRATVLLQSSPVTSATAASAWIDDYVHQRTVVGSSVNQANMAMTGDTVDAQMNGPSWILDFMVPPKEANAALHFETKPTLERTILITSIISVFILFIMGWGLVGAGIVIVVWTNSVVWLTRFRSDPAHRKMATLHASVSSFESQILSLNHELTSLKEERTNVTAQYSSQIIAKETEQKRLVAEEEQAVETCQRVLRAALSQLSQRRQADKQKLADDIRSLQSASHAKVALLQRQIQELGQKESDDIRNRLQAQQQRHVTAFLQQITIDQASLAGIGEVLKSRLRRAGFRTAADVTFRVQSVEGFGQSRAWSMVEWRKVLEARAQTTMPKMLASTELATIKATYESLSLTLAAETRREQQRQTDEEISLHQKSANVWEQINYEEKAAKAREAQESARIRKTYGPKYSSLSEAVAQDRNDLNTSLQLIDSKITRVRRDIFQLQWDKEKQMCELRLFNQNITYKKYVKQIFLGSR